MIARAEKARAEKGGGSLRSLGGASSPPPGLLDGFASDFDCGTSCGAGTSPRSFAGGGGAAVAVGVGAALPPPVALVPKPPLPPARRASMDAATGGRLSGSQRSDAGDGLATMSPRREDVRRTPPPPPPLGCGKGWWGGLV